MSKGIVVDHKEAGARYAIWEDNFDDATMVKVRDLKPGETVMGYTPKAVKSKEAKAEEAEIKKAEEAERAAEAANTEGQ